MNEPNSQQIRETFLERPLPSSPDAERVIRNCSFCAFSGSYEDFADGSICYLGVTACADCLQEEKTKDFREILTGKI